MDVHNIDRPGITVAGLPYRGPYGPGLMEFWGKVYYPWAMLHGLLNRARYGICHDDPDVVAPEQCRYDACVEVDKDFQPEGGAFKTALPGGRYAVLEFDGPIDQIGAAWASLMHEWVPDSGFRIDARPCFEHYPVDALYDPVACAMRCDLCIPVVPL